VTAGRGARRRLFVACDLPGPVEDAVAAWQRTELSPHRELRTVRPLHLTLVFLGDVPDERVPAVEQALGGVRWSGARAAVKGPIFLPAHGRRRVVALELEDEDGGLRAVQAEAVAALEAASLHTPEKRPWLPHVTVARFRRPGHPFSLQNVTIPGFGVVRMVLYSSHLEQAGAVHAPVAVFPAS